MILMKSIKFLEERDNNNKMKKTKICLSRFNSLTAMDNKKVKKRNPMRWDGMDGMGRYYIYKI